MNEKKLKQLFAAARNEVAPAPSVDFAGDVLRAVRREALPAPAASLSVWDHLNALFPRLALAAAAVIVLCVAADWGLTVAGVPVISDGATQLTSQFLFNSEDL
jgi:anti-sigma-K factor RskA